MKKNLLLAGFLISIGTFAQTAEERAVIKRNINSTELANLKMKFDKEYQDQQIKIQAYLLANPTAKKEFTIGKNFYSLQRIDADGNPIYINTKDANQVANAKVNSLYQGGSIGVNITGTNMVAGVWDGGQVNASHELLAGQVTMQANQPLNSTGGNNHMQAVAGIMVGKIVTNSSNPLASTARGLAPNATAKTYDWDNDLAEMTTFAADGFLISNHSYGAANDNTIPVWQFGAYDFSAKSWDMLLKNTPNYLPFVAGGNEQMSNGNMSAAGFDIMTGSSAAKNVVTVGAIDLDNSMSDYSNWGPTDDGRVKPDLVTLGSEINAPLYAGNNTYTGVVASSSGTSYAAPAAAAAGLLLQQYYKSIFGNYMKASSLKALMLHTADEAGNVGPDAKFGWGILNVERAAQTIKQMQSGGSAKLVEFTTNPANDSGAEINTTGIAGGGAARASICWTDDDGTEQTSANGLNPAGGRLVYNFDILFRQPNPFIDTRPFAPLSVSNPNALATVSTAWFGNSVDNYKQANISSTTANSNLIIYIRKASTSPAAVRNFSVILTGLKITSATLSTADVKASKNVVFFSKDDLKIKMISNDVSASFGEYKIYDMSGKMIQSAKEKSNEISFNVKTNGVYILVYQTKNGSETFRFKL
ncbi:hypothetical protein ASG01_08490 [Chryseobacterium sp. Leaf180]|uniref:S8 family peptidase n=1 Tax=Chryseobacterium sp. Leaf180 TaxID=1736289 RepID=UPI0006FF77B0|nr:S8 family peptidase [Chryseobacterium sp. Leaf180]KQR93887.1 hypothetical protein ASG01_08490 [Chryseobacterium sp. Leaf180]